ncbi:hypothetical protein ACFVT5_28305 [Streptomyces sp. NPDC058001]|uniref:hypothetical protein n=1 Tax=Streptomyces sp. NPDC058001 TaxID=3346300 RepID=UPI0036EB2461
MSYCSEVHAEGPVYGTGETAHHILGTFQTISPVLALRWLRSQALRIADHLDPDPARAPWAQPAPREPDCPTELRVWAEDREEHRAARAYLKAGLPLSATFPDTGCTYTLRFRPLHRPVE